MTETFVITFLTYIVAGSIPPLGAAYLLRISFLGGPGAAILVGIIGAVIGGLLDSLILTTIPDLLVIAGIVDTVPPFLASVVLTTLFGLVSATN